MRRRSALLTALLSPLVPAVAQDAGQDAARTAGRRAIALANAQSWAEAEATAQAAEPLIRKYVTWLRLQSRSAGARAPEVVAFALGNPDWPGQEALGRRAEEALAGDPDDALVGRWFAARPPRSLDAAQRLADALARTGRDTGPMLRSAWAEAPPDAAAEAAFLNRNPGLLRPDDHWRRFERLLLARDTSGAERAAAGLDAGRAALAGARLAYATDRPDAEAGGSDPALAAERARWLRRRDRDGEAAATWAAYAPPTDEAARAAWPERQLLARRLIRLGDPRGAYTLCAQHGITGPGEPRQEAEFLAGFLALRRLNDAEGAERHFIRLGEDSRSAITRARSLYWQGRALAARGAAAEALARHAAAAEFPLAFYGQLAAVALGEAGPALATRIRRTPPPPPTDARLFQARELPRLVLALAALGEARRTRQILLRLEELAPTLGDKAEAARLGARIGRPDHAVWVSRRAGAAGLMLLEEGWPTPYTPPPGGPEAPLIHAIARQESNFDPEAVSSANARGLMQLLPATAQQVARRLGLRHAVGMLTSDPLHNIRLGGGYLNELLGRFGGALPFAIAGYNAGPGRVDEWVGTFGDPRAGAIAMLDWMELIPFGETRNYVQRVLENLAIYRAKAGTAEDHPMTQWLQA